MDSFEGGIIFDDGGDIKKVSNLVRYVYGIAEELGVGFRAIHDCVGRRISKVVLTPHLKDSDESLYVFILEEDEGVESCCFFAFEDANPAMVLLSMAGSRIVEVEHGTTRPDEGDCYELSLESPEGHLKRIRLFERGDSAWQKPDVTVDPASSQWLMMKYGLAKS